VFSRQFYLLSALFGIIGPVVLIASFAINPAPPADYSVTQLREFAVQHHPGKRGIS
jgi:hypothetical protein